MFLQYWLRSPGPPVCDKGARNKQRWQKNKKVGEVKPDLKLRLKRYTCHLHSIYD